MTIFITQLPLPFAKVPFLKRQNSENPRSAILQSLNRALSAKLSGPFPDRLLSDASLSGSGGCRPWAAGDPAIRDFHSQLM
jgi:hypothetical protein